MRRLYADPASQPQISIVSPVLPATIWADAPVRRVPPPESVWPPPYAPIVLPAQPLIALGFDEPPRRARASPGETVGSPLAGLVALPFGWPGIADNASRRPALLQGDALFGFNPPPIIIPPPNGWDNAALGILARRFPIPYSEMFWWWNAPSVPPPGPGVPVLAGMVEYLLMYPSKGAALRDPVLALYYDDTQPLHPNCVPAINVLDRSTGAIDPRWGIFVLLPGPVVPALYFDPAIQLVLNVPPDAPTTANVVLNNLGKPSVTYQFLASGSGRFPVWPPAGTIG